MALTRAQLVLSVPPEVMALVLGLEAVGVAARAIIAEDKARVQPGPSAPAAPPLYVPVTPPGQSTPARGVFLGLARSPTDVRIMYDKIYSPLLRPKQ